MDVLLKKAKIYQSGSELDLKQKDILVQNGKITAIEDEINEKSYPEYIVITSPNLCVSAGWLDMSVALTDPGFEHKEDLISLQNSALAGGFIGIMTLPNSKPTVQSKESVKYLTGFSKSSPLDIYPSAAITKNCEGKDFTEMIDLHQAGAIAFTDGQNPLSNADIFLKTLQYLSQFNGLLINKPEDKHLAMFGLVHEGLISTTLGMKGIPALAEEMMILRDLELLQYAFSNEEIPVSSVLHFNTISSARSVEIIREAKIKKLPISCSVAAHQLVFTDESVAGFDSNYKVKPPFRSENDRLALIEAVKDGTIDVIVSDHCPQDEESKNLEFDLADFGVIGLETLFSSVVHFTDIPLEILIRCISQNPRKLLKLKKSSIEIGETASLSLFDPSLKTDFSLEKMISKSKNSPFINKTLQGKVIGIFNKNELVLVK